MGFKESFFLFLVVLFLNVRVIKVCVYLWIVKVINNVIKIYGIILSGYVRKLGIGVFFIFYWVIFICYNEKNVDWGEKMLFVII